MTRRNEEREGRHERRRSRKNEARETQSQERERERQQDEGEINLQVISRLLTQEFAKDSLKSDHTHTRRAETTLSLQQQSVSQKSTVGERGRKVHAISCSRLLASAGEIARKFARLRRRVSESTRERKDRDERRREREMPVQRGRAS